MRKGRTDAKETEPVPPVSDAVVDATLPHLPSVVVDMVRIARLTGARPGEICLMRPCDIEKTDQSWVYIPRFHKTEHYDKSRAVVIGPRGQEILTKYLDRDPDAFCFSPQEAVADHIKRRNQRRKTKLGYGNGPGDSAARRRGRKRKGSEPGLCYTNDSFRRAIHRACDRAFPPPEPLACRPGESMASRKKRLTKPQHEQLARWQSKHRWSPNQLRHSAATEIRERFGIEAVAAVLGHSHTDTSEIYALRNLSLAATVAKEIG